MMKTLGMILIAPFYLIVALVLGIMMSLAIYLVCFCELINFVFKKFKEVFISEDC